LTFPLREALYGLDCIAGVLDPSPTDDSVPDATEALMLKEPGNWRKHHEGGPRELMVQFHRIRYEWPHPEAPGVVGAGP
jgi:D-tagatose-1,6-bisphosphate aldolase subunit GatZ/KbaZ